MSRLVWVCAVLTLVVVAVAALRWALADFLLDQFGSLPDSLTRAQHSEDERLASERSEPLQSSLQSRGDRT
jgi:predicted PurR-regulated permease PerM